MKKILVLSAIMFLTVSAAFAQRGKKKTNPPAALKIKIMNSDRLPEGVYVKDNKIYAKKGYRFEKGEDNKAILKKAAAGNSVLGRFWCYCLFEGGCLVLITTNFIHCNPNGETPPCEACELGVLIGEPIKKPKKNMPGK